MKFRFDDQAFQADAVSSVVDLFADAIGPPFTIGGPPGADGHAAYGLDHDRLTENLAGVLARNELVAPDRLQLLSVVDNTDVARTFPNFSVEMETGTGKTYVYLRTCLRLAELHGLRKFVIVVHSKAIRAGVLKTLEQTREHFTAMFPTVPYAWGALGDGPALDDYLEPSAAAYFLVAMVQAFDQPDRNRVFQIPEQTALWADEQTGAAGIIATRPVVVVDEPQNMKTEKRTKALATLNPLVALRYSATHAQPFNLVHRLGPKAAQEQGLVKRVAVKSVTAGVDGSVAHVRVVDIRSRSRRWHASLEVTVRGAELEQRLVTVGLGADLSDLTGLDAYRGFEVVELDRSGIRFANGVPLAKGEVHGLDGLAIWRDQLRHTIRAHLRRQAIADDLAADLKVLSLFFVDSVADYRAVPGHEPPVLPDLFDEVYVEEWTLAGRDPSACPDPSSVRVAYFARTVTGMVRESAGSGGSEDDARAYEEIIANKELLLDRANPHAFIFSHSALREGWDNPNVFTIGLLRHTRSDIERRQQVGRGMRLPVDQEGERVFDDRLNLLTLVTDEPFDQFRDGFNAELAADGVEEPDRPEVTDVDQEVDIRRRPERYESDEFHQLWQRLRVTSEYELDIDPDELATRVAGSERLDALAALSAPSNTVTEAVLRYDESGRIVTEDDETSQSRGEYTSRAVTRANNLVDLVSKAITAANPQTQLTRATLATIIERLSGQWHRVAAHDPVHWSQIVAAAIQHELIEHVVGRTRYHARPEGEWLDADATFVEVETRPPAPPPDAGPMRGEVEIVPAEPGGPNLYDATYCDSQVEANFVRALDAASDVRLSIKLPRRLRLRTPVGFYSPDFAIVVEDEGHPRFLVRETKPDLDLSQLDDRERWRILFARAHFDAAPTGDVEFDHTTDDDRDWRVRRRD